MKMNLRLTIRVISAFVFAVALGVLLWYFYQSMENRALQRAIAAMRPQLTIVDGKVVEDEIREDGILKPFQDLLAENPDTIGWLTIDGTSVDYVVMHAPNEQDKYLHRDFYGNESRWGTLYVAESCDVRTSDNIIIYGHHMRDGTMFGALAQYESAEFYRAHPTVRFDTIYGTGTYEIVAVVRTDATIGSSAFPYYSYTQANDPETHAEYAAYVTRNRLYDTGSSIQEGDRLLTLSTCNYHTTNGRLIVVCRRAA